MDDKHLAHIINVQGCFLRGVMTRSKLFTYIEALFAVIVWGASFIATKVALQDISPITIVWLRFLMGVLILGLTVILQKQLALPAKKEWT